MSRRSKAQAVSTTSSTVALLSFFAGRTNSDKSYCLRPTFILFDANAAGREGNAQ